MTNDTPPRNPHHSDDTGGEKVILVEFVAEMVPHDSEAFRQRSRLAARPPVPEYLRPSAEDDP